MSLYIATIKLMLMPIIFMIGLPFFIAGFVWAWIRIAFTAGKIIGEDFNP